jgi:hypothetical protein
MLESSHLQSTFLKKSFAQKNETQLNKEQSILNYSLSDLEQHRLTQIYNEASDLPDNLKQEDYLVLANFFYKKIKKQVPDFTKNLEKLRDGNNYSAIFLKSLPQLKDESNQIHIAELMSLSFSLIIGHPFQYLQQNDARLVGRISPKKDFEMTQSGLSRNHFGWHSDDRIFPTPFRTEWIQLLGVHNPSQTETLIAPIKEIIKNLPANIIEILMDRRFEVKMPTSFGFKNSIWSEPISLIWKNEFDQYEVGVPTYNVRTVDYNDTEAQRAFQEFLKVIDLCQQSFIISNDSMLIFNNNHLLHGRAAISGDRMVLRTYIRKDLEELRRKTGTNGNFFDARFLL